MVIQRRGALAVAVDLVGPADHAAVQGDHQAAPEDCQVDHGRESRVVCSVDVLS